MFGEWAAASAGFAASTAGAVGFTSVAALWVAGAGVRSRSRYTRRIATATAPASAAITGARRLDVTEGLGSGGSAVGGLPGFAFGDAGVDSEAPARFERRFVDRRVLTSRA